MPILVSTVVNSMRARIDAEGSERYLFDQDFKPAINSAKDVIVTALNQAFAQNKLTPESLRELVKIRVWQASKYSRISYNEQDVGYPLWTIFGVYPDPVVNKKNTSVGSEDKSKSTYLKDVSYIGSNQSAKRLTLEQWNEDAKNIFVAGNEIIKGELSESAYLDFADYNSESYTAPKSAEIQVRPDISNKLCAIAFLKYPKNIENETDFLEFPTSLTELFTDTSLEMISVKENGGNLFQISESFVSRLISLIKS